MESAFRSPSAQSRLQTGDPSNRWAAPVHSPLPWIRQLRSELDSLITNGLHGPANRRFPNLAHSPARRLAVLQFTSVHLYNDASSRTHGEVLGPLSLEPPVERSVHADGTFAPLGRLECSSRIRWVGPDSSLKAALQNLRHSRPSRRLPPEGGVPVHGDKARNECSGISHPVPLPSSDEGRGWPQAG